MRESLRGTRGRAGKVATPPRARELGRVLQTSEARETLVLLVKGGYVGKDFPGAGLRRVAGRWRARSAAGALRRGNEQFDAVVMAKTWLPEAHISFYESNVGKGLPKRPKSPTGRQRLKDIQRQRNEREFAGGGAAMGGEVQGRI